VRASELIVRVKVDLCRNSQFASASLLSLADSTTNRHPIEPWKSIISK